MHWVPAELHVSVERVATQLSDRDESLAVAESCTGGLLGAVCTQPAGASRWFLGGIIAYANAVKHAQLGISLALIDQVGAVSEPVACQMADGVRRRFDASYGIGITGIAGPEGGTPGKPVGLVWIATASRSGQDARAYQFSGDRDTVRQQAVAAALEQLLECMRA
ncbi:MAG: CinA family protein [Gammaproteobacteria bacterium]|nr:CinA family protein [Gammaproteobacteria bacterium]